MKTFLSLIACVAFAGALNAQTTTTEPASVPAKAEKAAKVEKKGCAKGETKSGCCAGKAKASTDANAITPGSETAIKDDTAPKSGCCAGKAKASASGTSCHGAKAQAHEHAHGDMKEHACTEACKNGTHALACGEKGHTCSDACHAHKH